MRCIKISGNTFNEVLKKCKSELLNYFIENNTLNLNSKFFIYYEKHIYNYIIMNSITKCRKYESEFQSYNNRCNIFLIELDFRIDLFIKNFIKNKDKRFKIVF